MPLVIKTDGPRLCIRCVAARVPEPHWGAWTWGFGDCQGCSGFGITTKTEHVEVTAAALRGSGQGELFIDR